MALKHKDDLTELKSLEEDVELRQWKSVGAVWVVYEVGKRLGIEEAMGRGRAGRLAFWQVIARVINHGSRLSSVRLADTHAVCDILGIRDGFNEEHHYKNLA